MEPTGPATLHENMPASEYHNDPCEQPSLSSHVARKLLDSPAKAFREHPKLGGKKWQKDRSKFDLGTCAHEVFLEGSAKGFVVIEADDWRKKSTQEARDEAHLAGKAAVLSYQFDDVQGMVKAAEKFISESEFADDWMAAKSEVSVTWQDNGVWCRARLDKVTNDRKIIFDFKTTDASVSPASFGRTFVNVGYPFQDAFYRRGIQALDGHNPKFIFLAQEIEAPYECAFHACDPSLAAVAEFQVERAIGIWRDCLTTGKWPGYGNRVHWHNAPSWMLAQHESLLMENT